MYFFKHGWVIVCCKQTHRINLEVSVSLADRGVLCCWQKQAKREGAEVVSVGHPRGEVDAKKCIFMS